MSKKMIFSGSPILAAFVALVLCLCSAPGMARVLKVSTPEELRQALTDTTGGTILLTPGEYGELKLSQRRYAAPVILKSEVPRRAVFTKIALDGARNLMFDGMQLQQGFSATNKSSDITLTNIDSKNVLYFRDVSNLVVQNVSATGGQYGIILNSVQNFTVTHSLFGDATEDVMRITGDSYGGLVEYNLIYDVIAVPPTHPDLIQLFAARGKTPHDIAIRRNLLRDKPDTGPKRSAQGIFMSDPAAGGYRNMLIEENLISVKSPNSIYINGGQANVVVQNNILIPGAGDGGAMIRLAEKSGRDNSGTTVSGNIAKLLNDETQKSKIQRNYLYGRKAALARLFPGRGDRWQDFVPLPRSGAAKSGMGAREFLQELADGRARLGPDWLED